MFTAERISVARKPMEIAQQFISRVRRKGFSPNHETRSAINFASRRGDGMDTHTIGGAIGDDGDGI